MKTTPLIQIHRDQGAKFGEFAGYEMPLFFPAGIIKEHLHTRASAGLFDISHMMHVGVTGKDAANLINFLCPLEVDALDIGEAKYTFLLNENAGIIDDLIVTRLAEQRYLMVCNAGRAEEDWTHIESNASNYNAEVNIQPRGFIALQGPLAQSVLGNIGIDTQNLEFMRTKEFNNNLFIARGGYTGEDGFEVAAPVDEIADFAHKLLSDERVMSIGLGARDSLRLEAGLSLYGQDLDMETTPMEAGLVWAIPKHLRQGGAFHGATALGEKISNKRTRKRIGLIPQGKAPIRAGTPLFDKSNTQIGTVTSGGFGPSVGHPVALGMVDISADMNSLEAQVRAKRLAVKQSALPFVPHNYKH